MTEEERNIGVFQVLLRMVNIAVPDKMADLILRTTDLYRRKKGKSNVDDAFEIVSANKKVYNPNDLPNDFPWPDEEEDKGVIPDSELHFGKALEVLQ